MLEPSSFVQKYVVEKMPAINSRQILEALEFHTTTFPQKILQQCNANITMRFCLKLPGKETKADLQRIADAAFASLESIQINLVIFYFYKRNGIPKERMRALILASFFLILKLALLSSANCHI